MTVEFMTSEKVFHDLMKKYGVKSLTELHRVIEGKSGVNDDRDLFFGAIFAHGVGQVQKHQCVLKIFHDEPWDIEMVDKTQLDKGEIPNHFYIQNVHITHHYIEAELKNGLENIYEIFCKFLYEKKLSPLKADYKGGLLVFHVGSNIQGKFDLRILRVKLRQIQQTKFQQIWITSFSQSDYSQGQLAELLLDDRELLLFPIPNN